MPKRKTRKPIETPIVPPEIIVPDVLYDGIERKAWKEELTSQSEWNLRHALTAFALLGRPNTLWDIGCGDGTLVNTARRLGNPCVWGRSAC